MFIIRKIWSLITLPVLLLTLITSPVARSTESAELISRDAFVLEKAFFMCQGITTDGEYYYTSGANTTLNLNALAKFTVDDMKMADWTVNPLPDKCEDRGNNHIGGISYYNGKIYAAVEDGADLYPCIVVYDCKTLKHTGEVYDLPLDLFFSMPWCAVDSETGYLYTSNWRDNLKLFVYDVNNSMSFVKEIELKDTEAINRIQGGEFYNGKLYLSADTLDNGSFKNIYCVDIESGKTEIAFVRDVGGENVEAEGLTFFEDKNGAVMHVLDYNEAIGMFVHHYKINDEN